MNTKFILTGCDWILGEGGVLLLVYFDRINVKIRIKNQKSNGTVNYFLVDEEGVLLQVYQNKNEKKTNDNKCKNSTYRESLRSGRGGRPPSGL